MLRHLAADLTNTQIEAHHQPVPRDRRIRTAVYAIGATVSPTENRGALLPGTSVATHPPASSHPPTAPLTLTDNNKQMPATQHPRTSHVWALRQLGRRQGLWI